MTNILQFFTEKFYQTTKRGGLLDTVLHFNQIDDFPSFFGKWGTFCNFFRKSWLKRRNMVVSSKKLQAVTKSTIFHAFWKMRHPLQLSAEKLTETLKHGCLLQKVEHCGQIDDFSCFFKKWGTFFNFSQKLTQTPRHRALLEKVAYFGEINDFSCFLLKWGTVCNFLLKSWPKRRNVAVCSRKFFICVKWTISHAFSRNEALFATFCWKVDTNADSWWFPRTGFKLWRNRRVFIVFRKMRYFLQVFAEKLTETSKRGSLLQSVEHFCQIDDFSCFRAKSGTFCNFFLRTWPKRRATWWFAQKRSTILQNRRFFMLSCEMGLFLHFFAEKSTQTPKHGGFLEKVASFCQIDDFPCFSAKWGTFCNFLLKSLPKRRNVLVCSIRFYILAKSTIFSWFFAKWGTFCMFLLKSWPKQHKVVIYSKKLDILAKSTIFHAFLENEALFGTFSCKVDPNTERSWFSRKTCKFWANQRFFMVFREIRQFYQLFADKLTQMAKRGSLLEKVAHLGQIDDSPCFFEKLSSFCNFLLKSWPKRRHMVVCSKKLQVLTKSTIFRTFSRNQALFATFSWKDDPNEETWWFARRRSTVSPNRRFVMLFREMRHFLLESWPKRQNMVVCSKDLYIFTNWTIFHASSTNEALLVTFC